MAAATLRTRVDSSHQPHSSNDLVGDNIDFACMFFWLVQQKAGDDWDRAAKQVLGWKGFLVNQQLILRSALWRDGSFRISSFRRAWLCGLLSRTLIPLVSLTRRLAMFRRGPITRHIQFPGLWFFLLIDLRSVGIDLPVQLIFEFLRVVLLPFF